MKAKPVGIFLIAIFFALATCVLISVGLALLFPGTEMEAIWRLYPARRALLMPHRNWLGPGFLTLAFAMACASIGCFRRRTWGWSLAVAIFALNGIGDAVQLAMGHWIEGAVGVIVAGAVLLYLSRLNTKRAFRR